MPQSVSHALSVRAVCFVLVLLVGAVANAQSPPVSYRFDWAPVPAGVDIGAVNNLNSAGVVVGRTHGTAHEGFIYDSQGVYGAANVLHSLSEFMAIPPEWARSSCTGINDAGVVVGYLTNDLITRGFVLDLNTRAWAYLPHPAGSNYVIGRRINNAGQVLGYFQLDSGNFAYLYNVGDSTTQYAVLTNPATSAPIALNGYGIDLNNQGHVGGQAASGHFRLIPGVNLQWIVDSDLLHAEVMNDFDVLCGYGKRYIRRNSTLTTACVYTDRLDWASLGSERTEATDINNAGDLSVQVDYYRLALYHNSSHGMLNVDGLLSPNTPQADRDFWNSARLTESRLNERGGTGFPQISGVGSITTYTGGGKNRIAHTAYRLFVLTPQ